MVYSLILCSSFAAFEAVWMARPYSDDLRRKLWRLTIRASARHSSLEIGVECLRHIYVGTPTEFRAVLLFL